MRYVSTERASESKAAYEATVIELHGDGVLQDVTPPQVRFILLLSVRGVEEFVPWWTEPSAHQRELVV